MSWQLIYSLLAVSQAGQHWEPSSSRYTQEAVCASESMVVYFQPPVMNSWYAPKITDLIYMK